MEHTEESGSLAVRTEFLQLAWDLGGYALSVPHQLEELGPDSRAPDSDVCLRVITLPSIL